MAFYPVSRPGVCGFSGRPDGVGVLPFYAGLSRGVAVVSPAFSPSIKSVLRGRSVLFV